MGRAVQSLEVSQPEPPSPSEESALLDTAAWDARAARRRAATAELPPDVKNTARFGLTTTGLIGAVVLASYLVLVVATAPRESTLWTELFPTYLHSLVPGIVLCLAMAALARTKRIDTDLVLRLGLVYLVLFSFVLGLFRHSHAWPDGEALRQWSPVAVFILLFGALVPERPNRVLLWSLLAASMDPFALLAAKQRVPSQSEGLLLSLSPFLGALMAYATSNVVYGLSERIAKAREFGSYRLVERLGVGGMAEVWRADHSLLARPAALKLIRPSVLSAYGPEESKRLVRLFEREVQATAALRSPHTIVVYDFGVAQDGTFYYVMELLDGYDLQTLVERFGPLPPERAVHVLRQVCHSLREAHRASFVHRDLKPGNIYVCRHGADVDFAKVLDFGLVLDRRPTAEELDEKRKVIGTPAVMAPEMMRFGAPVDQRTDIYALGCVAYWLLTGHRIFEAESRQDMMVMHAHQRPIPPSRRIKAPISPGLEALVMRCVDKNPDQRPQSAAELSAELAALHIDAAWTEERARAWWEEHPVERP